MKNLLFILFLFPAWALAQTTISTNQIRDGAVTYVKVQQLPGLTMFGRSANSTGTGGSITAGLDGQVLRRSGTTLAFGALDLGSANSTTGQLSFTRVTSGSLLSDFTLDGDASSFTLTDINAFNVSFTSMTWNGTSGSTFNDAGGFSYNSSGATMSFSASGTTYLTLDGGTEQAVLSGGGASGVIVATGDAGIHIDNSNSNDVRIFGDDFNVNVTDDFLIDNNPGTTDQAIINTNGHPAWGPPYAYREMNTIIYSSNHVLTAADTKTGKVHMRSTSSTTFTVPSYLTEDLTTGAQVVVFADSADVTIVAGAGVQFEPAGADLTLEEDQYAVIIKRNETNTWDYLGPLTGGGSGTPGGADTQVQYNDSGAFNGEADMTYNETTNTLTVDVVAVDTEVYDATNWNADLSVPTKDAVRDKIESLAAGSAHTIENENSALTQRGTLNFLGNGVTAADDAGGAETEVTIPGIIQNKEFNVMDYGATGDGTTDDLAALQAAVNAAIAADGRLIIPAPSVGYRITNTLVIGDGSGFIWIDIDMMASERGKGIIYDGPDDDVAIQIVGLKAGRIEGIKLKLATGVTGTDAVQIGTSASAGSTSSFTISNMEIEINNGVDNRGVVLGTPTGGGNDVSQILFQNCSVWGVLDSGATGQVGFVNEGTNTLELTWVSGAVVYLETGVKVTSGGAMDFFGFGGSHCDKFFHFVGANNFNIFGGRFEVGEIFVDVDGSTNAPMVNIDGPVLGDFHPGDGFIFIFDAPGTFTINNIKIEDETNITGPIVSLGGDGGSFFANGGAIRCTSATMTNVSATTGWKLNIKDVHQINEFGQHIGYFKNQRDILDVDAADSGNIGAGEDVLWTYTLQQDRLYYDEQTLRIRVAGSNTANGNNKRLKLKFGATNIVDPGINGITGTWIMDCDITRISNTVQKCNCAVTALSGTHTVLSDIAETLSADVVIQLTGEAVANDDIVKESAKVFYLD